ncbi:MAG TPA: phosphonate ABC transporter [Prochlorococcus sp.]|jgi:phosphonate transport system permease protein
MNRLSPTPTILSLLPALALIPVIGVVVTNVHDGGRLLLVEFVGAALQPSLDPVVVQSAWHGLQITVATALFSWAISSFLGILLGVASASVVWQTCVGQSWPAIVIRRFLAIPRAIHELLWGLLLLQILGLSPWVAILAIIIPYTALVARVVSDQLDTQDRRALIALQQSGSKPFPVLITALGPKMGPVLISYIGYRLECALRGATLLGVFGMGGLGIDIQLAFRSLDFQELWTPLWMLAGVMFSLEQILSWFRSHLRSSKNAIKQMIITVALMIILTLISVPWLNAVDIDLSESVSWNAFPWPTVAELKIAFNTLPWIQLVSSTIMVTLLAAGIAIGIPPMGMMLWPSRVGIGVQSYIWALLRLIPTPISALLLLLFSQTSLAVAALALGAHNLGVMGRLLKEGLDEQSNSGWQSLRASGSGTQTAWLYGCFSGQSPSYLAYAAYRTDVILRETVVVGWVGGTGLGWQLIESLGSFNWAQVALLTIVFATLTLIGETLSDQCRQHWLGPSKVRPMILDLQS